MGIYGTRDGKFQVKKLSVEDKMPVTYTIPYAIGISTTYFLAGWNVTATAAKLNVNLSAQPPYPVELSVHAVAAGTAANTDALTIIGKNAKGTRVSESVIVSSTAGTINYTNNAFSKITSITPDAGNVSTDVNIGFRNVIGLPYPIESASDILTAMVGIEYATTALTVDTTYDNIDVNTALTVGSTASFTWLSKVQ